MKPTALRIELDLDDLASRLDEIEAVLGRGTTEPFHQLLAAYAVLLQLLLEKEREIERLEKQRPGNSTERTSQLFPEPPASGEDGAADARSPSSSGSQPDSVPAQNPNPSSRRRRRGHGRIPARAYTGCTQTMVTHESLHPGESCPHCTKGTLYRQNRWAPLVRLKGQVCVTGTVYHLERLRCNACGEIETARLPDEAGTEKYDVTVPSVIALLRYGEGLPWNRMQRLQLGAGIPLPASLQWQLVRDALPRGIRAAYDHALVLAAQDELIHNDDTSMCVLSLEKKLKKGEPLLEQDPDRRGVFTTGILSHSDNRPDIALFFTGPHHSGENLRDLLAKRQAELPPPVQMCDALACNMPKDLKAMLGNCLAHGRRNFVGVVGSFPTEVQYVLERLKSVYKTDGEAKKRGLSSEERLRLHEQESRPVMDELHRWFKQQFDEKKVEPNSSLGGAISYMLRHWEKLTLFLRVPGVPLDNNICERALKMAIRHRKNSLFYKTMSGAMVGDIYMSLIHTCYLCGANPFDYLTELQRNHERVRASPGDWMPWNYKEQFPGADPGPESTATRPPDTAETQSAPAPDS